MCLYSRIYLIWHLQDWRGAGLLNIPFVNQNLCWPEFLQVLFSLCFFIPYLVMNRASCAAIMILRLVALPGFLIISSVSGIVNVMSLIVPAAPSFTYYGFCGSHYNSSVGSVKSRLLNVQSQYHYAYCKVLTPELLELEAIFLICEVSGFLEYQLHIKGTVLYF